MERVSKEICLVFDHFEAAVFVMNAYSNALAMSFLKSNFNEAIYFNDVKKVS